MVVAFVFLEFEGLRNGLKIFIDLFYLLSIKLLRVDENLSDLLAVTIDFLFGGYETGEETLDFVLALWVRETV